MPVQDPSKAWGLEPFADETAKADPRDGVRLGIMRPVSARSPDALDSEPLGDGGVSHHPPTTQSLRRPTPPGPEVGRRPF